MARLKAKSSVQAGGEQALRLLHRQLQGRFRISLAIVALCMAGAWWFSASLVERDSRIVYLAQRQDNLSRRAVNLYRSTRTNSATHRKKEFAQLATEWRREASALQSAMVLAPSLKNAHGAVVTSSNKLITQLQALAEGKKVNDGEFVNAAGQLRSATDILIERCIALRSHNAWIYHTAPLLPLAIAVLVFVFCSLFLVPTLLHNLYTLVEGVRRYQKEETQKNTQIEKNNASLQTNNQQLGLALVRTLEILDRFPTPCFTFDTEGKVLEWNQAAAETFGKSATNAIGQPFWHLLPDSHFAVQGQALVKTLLTGEIPAPLEWTYRRSGQGERLLFNHTFPVHDAQGQVQGGVHINFDHTDRRQTQALLEDKVRQISRFNDDLNSANARLESLATTDGLTGLKNHRAFQEILDSYFKDSQKHHKPLSVVLVDVDNFKKFNDMFGHPEGDEVLRVLSTILRNHVRRGDFVARYGGEEFIVLLPMTDTQEAIQLTQRLHKAIHDHIWRKRTVTASFGVASYSAAMQYPSDLIVQADQALYTSKRRGRDRITHYEEQRTAHDDNFLGFSDDKMRMDSEPQIMHLSAEDLVKVYDAAVVGWSRLLTLRDEETEAHSERVTELTLRVARLLKIEEDRLVYIRWGALLHDIGKIGIPDRILSKPGALTDEEREVMSHHPSIAYEMLAPIAFLRPALAIPFCHHEKWDGTGYPRGLKGEEIPLEARIFALVDVWDALRSDRPYRKRWPKTKVIDHIKSLAGTHFDPQLTEVFLEVVQDPNQR
jgi:diguanylate cyclase (GGDEF)-like protein/PAS domain S-box-containing protein/putative nucleotidyltransferase with HDIG domain